MTDSSKASLVLRVVGERAKDDAAGRARDSGDKAKPAQGQNPPAPLKPFLPPEPLAPEPPVLTPVAGHRLDDFQANSKPGDKMNLPGGQIVRTSAGYQTRRHGGGARDHPTPHDAAHHLASVLGLERHERAVAGHEQRVALTKQAHGEQVRAEKIQKAEAKAEASRVAESRLVESPVALPHFGTRTTLHFDPRLHARDRVGKFRDMLAKLERAGHGSTLHLPHGIEVRRRARGLEVSGGGVEPHELDSAAAAAGEALHRHVHAEIARGADHRHETTRLLEDLGQARRDANAAQDAAGARHLESHMRETRRARGAVEAPPARNVAGRSRVAVERYRAEHANVPASVGARNVRDSLARARASRRPAMTGAEIDAQSRRIAGPRLEAKLAALRKAK